MPFVTSFERFARQEGRQEGRMEGRQEGLQLGQEKGRQEGQQLGQIEALKDAIGDVLITRFGQVPQEVAVQLKACQDAVQLRRWHRQAVTAADLATASQHFN